MTTALGGDLAAALDPARFAQTLGLTPEPWQGDLLRSGARRVLVNCARQVGKSTVVSLRALHAAVYEAGSLTLVISPGQRQSNELLTKVRTLYRMLGSPPRSTRDSETELALDNGSRIVSLPGIESTIRGYSAARLLIIDEASRVDDDVFAAVLPMVASTGAVWALSTPWGRRGWWYQLHQDPRNEWQRHSVSVYESAQYNPSRINELRNTVGSFVFASDYECQFGDTDTQLFGTEVVRAAIDPAVQPLRFEMS